MAQLTEPAPALSNDGPLLDWNNGDESLFVEAEKAYAAISVNGSASTTRAIELYTRYLGIATPNPLPEGDQECSASPLKDELVKHHEIAICRIGELLIQMGNWRASIEFIRSLGRHWSQLPRAKAAKLLRDLLDVLARFIDGLEGPEARQLGKAAMLTLCEELVQWATREKRAFLKQALELRLAGLQLDNRKYSDALAMVSALLRELKRMDDKLTLVEVHLLECRIYFQLHNGPKARAALTAARSNANAIYCPPAMQAALDMQAGLLHADEGDFSTAYSYFMEALDAYGNSLGNDPKGGIALKYMLLCKIMLGSSHIDDELSAILGSKLAIKYVSQPQTKSQIGAMKAVAAAYQNRSLKEFENALAANPTELGSDVLIHAHFQTLYDQLLQQNLLRIVRPYERVQLSHIAQQIELPISVVENRLALMILDKQLPAIIDQSSACLLMIEERPNDGIFLAAADTVRHLNSAVDALYAKARSII